MKRFVVHPRPDLRFNKQSLDDLATSVQVLTQGLQAETDKRVLLEQRVKDLEEAKNEHR